MIITGKCIHSMVAHLDEVTSVDCDPNGWYILSGSKWQNDSFSKIIVQFRSKK